MKRKSLKCIKIIKANRSLNVKEYIFSHVAHKFDNRLNNKHTKNMCMNAALVIIWISPLKDFFKNTSYLAKTTNIQ